jgi:DNA-binding transcriptional MerR regulator
MTGDTKYRWRVLTAKDIAVLLGIPRRKVLYYVEHNMVKPQIKSPGTGSKRRYNLNDAVCFDVIAKMDRLGIAPRFLKKISKSVRELVDRGAGSISLDNIEDVTLSVALDDIRERLMTAVDAELVADEVRG